MSDTPTFYNNTRVKRTKDYNEYLALHLRPLEGDEVGGWKVHVYRYCVPGRCDTYSFTWKINRPCKVEYFSDGWENIVDSANMVKRDLNKASVVDMFLSAISDEKICCYYRNDLMNLLKVIGPKSKTFKAVKVKINKVMKGRSNRLVEQGWISKESADRLLLQII